MHNNSEYGKNIFFRLFFSILYFVSVNLIAQDAKAYNEIYTKTYLDISQKDFPKALQIADSLYTISETPRFKAKSLMLSATLLQQSGETKKALEYAVKAGEVLKGSDDYVWKAKVSGFLSSQYRHLKLFDQSKKYIDETIENVSKIEDQRLVNQTMGFVMQEKAYYELEHKNYKKSIQLINDATKYFGLSEQSNPFLEATNEQLLGLNYFHLNDYQKANNFYQKALEKLNKMPDNFLKGLVLNGLAQIHITKKDPEKAKPLIEQAQKIAEESPFLSLKNEILQSSQQYYALTKDIEKLEEAKLKQDSVTEKIAKSSSAFINDSYNDLKKSNEDIEKVSEHKNLAILTAVLIMIVAGISFIWYRKRQEKKFEKIREIIDEMERSKLLAEQNEKDEEEPAEDEEPTLAESAYRLTDSQPMMTAETEEKILRKLEKFEQSGLFNRNNVSLPYVASYCNTNTKYLSYVVNTYKKKDFKNYINELRVKYIIHKLKNDSQYHKYKISTLAEEAGFSSQSKFAAAFRKVTSVSPSEFLEHLKETNS